jgi:hypothetical protein
MGFWCCCIFVVVTVNSGVAYVTDEDRRQHRKIQLKLMGSAVRRHRQPRNSEDVKPRQRRAIRVNQIAYLIILSPPLTDNYVSKLSRIRPCWEVVIAMEGEWRRKRTSTNRYNVFIYLEDERMSLLPSKKSSTLFSQLQAPYLANYNKCQLLSITQQESWHPCGVFRRTDASPGVKAMGWNISLLNKRTSRNNANHNNGIRLQHQLPMIYEYTREWTSYLGTGRKKNGWKLFSKKSKVMKVSKNKIRTVGTHHKKDPS